MWLHYVIQKPIALYISTAKSKLCKCSPPHWVEHVLPHPCIIKRPNARLARKRTRKNNDFYLMMCEWVWRIFSGVKFLMLYSCVSYLYTRCTSTSVRWIYVKNVLIILHVLYPPIIFNQNFLYIVKPVLVHTYRCSTT